jgi:hypothetical protein
MKSVYCAVRTGSLNKAVCASSFKGLSFGQAQAVSRWTVTAEVRIQFYVRISGGRSGTGTDISLSIAFSQAGCHCTNATYLFMHLYMTLYNFSN